MLHRTPLEGMGELLAAGLALTGASSLIAAGAFVLVRLLLRRGAVVVIDTNGIHDRRIDDALLPWSRIRDIRVLDRHGNHIGIETLDDDADAAIGSPHATPRYARTMPVTVIDTFFLRSRSGNRILDFIVPITAVAPIDMSETPVSEETLSADARISWRRKAAIATFVAAAAVAPAAAATFLVTL
ncbi:MAG: hypothetical protein ACREF6_02740 [Alphaproteobacteria bacterium]